jgi:penicillin V acylase-like amidase (Ntn superfamily)
MNSTRATFDVERRKFCKRAAGGLAASVASFASLDPAAACTRVLWNTTNERVVVGRTMDWPESTEPMLYALPAGMKRDGGVFGQHVVIADNPARWVSKYGSLVTTVYDLAAADGLNERGLAGHLLYLTSTDFGPRDASKPAMHAGFWLQFALDNAATVSEAIKLLDPIEIVMVEARGHKASVHLALEDATGDSAIMEYIGGKRLIHHGRQYHVMTNDPPFQQQLALLEELKQRTGFRASRYTPLPGNLNAVDRFQRAVFFSRFLPEPKDERQAIAAMFSLMANVSVPFGAPYDEFGTYNTEYRSVMNLTNTTYYFQLTTVPSVCWTALSKLNLSVGAPTLALDPDSLGLTGDVASSYHKATAPF